ncbi:hypothetical protein LDL36_18010 [Komagataeibacter sp. FNDCR1]|nr:hypothetical protein [Komagataeibacter sp. FNDCR1]
METKFGIVLFDDDKDPREGWCAPEGGKARRIGSMHELSTDTIWWTNLSYDAMFRQTKAGINPWLRHDAYLVVKPRDALTEWGHNAQDMAPDAACEFLAQVFSRVMNLAAGLFRDCEPGMPEVEYFTKKTLRHDLARLLPPGEYPTDEAAAILRSGQAYSEYTTTTLRSPRGSRRIALRRPRMSHAMEMLTTPVPVGRFELVPARRLGKIPEERVAAIREMDRPCMVEITVRAMDGDVAPVYGFGNSMDKTQVVRCSWVTHPEFLTMSAFSDLDVKCAYVGESYTQLNLLLPQPMQDLLSSQFAETSWSAGILAETIWRAATMMPDTGRGMAGAEKPGCTWRGAWLKAADKTATFVTALKLTEQGWPAGAYGLGGCWVSGLEEQLRDLVKDGLQAGYMPRMFDIPPDMFPPGRRVGWGGDKRCEMLSHLMMTRDLSMLWNMDRLLLIEPGQRTAHLRKIMEAKKAGRL